MISKALRNITNKANRIQIENKQKIANICLEICAHSNANTNKTNTQILFKMIYVINNSLGA